jgi:hypothetical protein
MLNKFILISILSLICVFLTQHSYAQKMGENAESAIKEPITLPEIPYLKPKKEISKMNYNSVYVPPPKKPDPVKKIDAKPIEADTRKPKSKLQNELEKMGVDALTIENATFGSKH